MLCCNNCYVKSQVNENKNNNSVIKFRELINIEILSRWEERFSCDSGGCLTLMHSRIK